MLETLDYSHPVFSDFKHIRLSGDVSVSFEPGTGGNFLITCATQNFDIGSDAIDFHDSKKVHLDCDGCFDNVNEDWQLNLNLVHSHAANTDYSPGNKIFACHYLPYLTSRIFTFEVPYILMIDAAPGDRWLPHALALYKNQFSSDYQSRPDMLGQLVQYNPYNGPVDMQEYKTLMRRFNDQFGQIDFAYSPITWRYYIDCKHKKLDLLDLSNWSDYLLSWICSPNEAVRFYDHAVSLAARKYLKEAGYDFVAIDYVDLIFKFQIPELPFFVNTTKEMLANYSSRNIQALYRFINLLEPRHRGGFSRRVDQFANILSASI